MIDYDKIKEAMLADGIEMLPNEIIVDDEVQRFSTKPGARSKSGYYRFNEMGGLVYGYYGDWRTGVKGSYSSRGKGAEMTPEERQWLAVERGKEKRRREKEIEEGRNIAAKECVDAWNNSDTVSPNHPYIARKQITNIPAISNCVRQSIENPEVLFVKMINANKEIRSIQKIYPDGGKRFWKGSGVAGLYACIGIPATVETMPIRIGEGLATMATVNELTGDFSVCAFSAANLPTVAEIMRKKFPKNPIIIMGDSGHPGDELANQAAEDAGGKVCLPPIEWSDWNDVFCEAGPHKTIELMQTNEQEPTLLGKKQAPEDEAESPSGAEYEDYPEVAMASSANEPAKIYALPSIDDSGLTPEEIESLFEGPPVMDVLKSSAPVMPVDNLPAVLRDFALDVAARTGTDPAMSAVAALVACASLIHDEIKLQPKARDTAWQESARLWGALIGNPSSKKTPVLNSVIAPLKKIAGKATERNNMKAAEAKLMKNVYDKQMRAVEKKLADGEDADKVKVPEPPKEPLTECVMVSDVTIEALARRLEHCPRGTLVNRDELSGFVRSMGQYKSGSSDDRAKWLSAYNGGSEVIDRVKAGTIHIPNWSACVLGGIQPDTLESLRSGDEDDGFWPRFIMVFAASSSFDHDDANIDDAARDRYHRVCEQLYNTQPSGGNPIKMEPGCASLRQKLYELLTEVETNPLYESTGLVAAVGKYGGLWARLCLTFYCIECADANKYPDGPIPERIAHMAHRFITQALMPQHIHFYEETGGDSSFRNDIAFLYDMIVRQESYTITRSEIRRNSRRLRDSGNGRRLDAMMNLLVDMNWLIPASMRKSQRGRDTRWKIHPALLRDYVAASGG